MSNDIWQDLNSQYLATSLAWLRLKLLQLVPKLEETVLTPQSAPTAAPAPAGRSIWPLGRKSPVSSASQQGTASLPASSAPSLPGAAKVVFTVVDDAFKARELAAAIDPAPALIQLALQFGLSEFERDVVLLSSAVEFDAGFAPLIAQAQPKAGRDNPPTFSLALAMFDNPHWDALSAQGPLRNSKLVEVNQPGSTPLTLSGLRTDERILGFIKGINALDDRLKSLVTEVDNATQIELSESQQETSNRLLNDLHSAISDSVVPIVQLMGTDRTSKIGIASQVCAAIGSRMFRVAAEALPAQSSEIENFAKLWQRETCLLPITLYIDAEELDNATSAIQAGVERLLSHRIGLVIVGVRENTLKLDVPVIGVEITKPTPSEQFKAWIDALKVHEIEDELTAQQLAGQFDLSLAEVHSITDQAARVADDTHPIATELWDLCRGLTKPRLDELAARIDTKATWDDLVLPDEQMKLMQSITQQVRERYQVYNEWGFAARMNRGLGIAALFAGESGTGKTMAAEVIANDLRLNLYRIDLSSVVSKYIGETEKNLRKLFDAAEQGGAILFFDEADALFGKRSEVKDSHDRYANIEINYLLQRMESFRGLAILATNVKTALDPAFMRRLRFIVNFPFPASADRKRIWQKAFPAETPQEELDFDRLAKLSVTGANIQAIALNAAFMAAGTGTSVTMPALLTAAYREMRKLDRPLTGAELQ